MATRKAPPLPFRRPVNDPLAWAEQQKQIEEWNVLVSAFKTSRNGLLLWQLLVLLQRANEPVPDGLRDAFAALGERLLMAAKKKTVGAVDYQRALELPSGARGFSAWQRAKNDADRVRRIRAVQRLMMRRPALSLPEACAEVARTSNVANRTLLKDFYTLTERTKQAKARRASDAAKALETVFPQRRKSPTS